ncbi:MAG TPA: hypothetical protein VIM37_01415 [Candidatus Microsaccharimonas sp.]|jgi:hypothetical protein
MNEEQIEEKITLAYKLVKKADIQEESLLVEAFKFALGTNVTAAPMSSVGPTAHALPLVEGAHVELSKIATALGISYDIIELFYAIEDNELTLNLPSKLVPAGNTPAMKEIAIMLSVGRKHAGLGVGTPFELIRTACDDHGKLDSKNFAAAMNSLKPNLVPSGKGAKELVPKRPADDLAKELIQKYNGTAL